MTQRELTPREERAIGLCRAFDKALDERRLTVVLYASQDAAQAIQKLECDFHIVRTLKVDVDKKAGNYAITFTTTEFGKYLNYILPQLGLTTQLDGSLKTEDGLTITNDYVS